MSCRSIIRDLRSRSDIICLACLSKAPRKSSQSKAAEYSTQSDQKSAKSKFYPQLSTTRKKLIDRPGKGELARKPVELQRLPGLGQRENDQEGYSVRFFEQSDGNRTRELRSEEEFDASYSSLDTADFKESLLDLRRGIKSNEEKDAFQAVLSEAVADWDKMKNASDLEVMIKKMDAYTMAIDDQIREVGLDLPKGILDDLLADGPYEQDVTTPPITGPKIWRTAPPRIPPGPWSVSQAVKIQKLNTALSQTYTNTKGGRVVKKRNITTLYKAYFAARIILARSWDHVSPDTWHFLWKIFSTDDMRYNENRLAHISLLTRDMSEAKVALTPVQQLLAIEALFVQGWETKAIENWKRCVPTLGLTNNETFQQFWELGVRMYCRRGEVEQAERAIQKLLDNHRNPRILMPLIHTCCEQGTTETRDKAWKTYRRMRELLGQDMKLSDYDQVISYFLSTAYIEQALYAFVDMMSNGAIDLTLHRYMPSVVANRFFIGKWLKRLIGAGDLEGAYSVIEFMSSKGVEPAPIQVNGLIGAWLRSGGAKNVAKADALAWRMIESRIKFVRDRKVRGSIKAMFAVDDFVDVTKATPETFYLLAENYKTRGLHKQLLALWAAFREAELRPEDVLMNHLLESHIAEGQSEEALETYRFLVREQGVKPDPHTFSALWKTLAVNRLHVIELDGRQQDARAARALFREIVSFRGVFPPEGMDGQLARKILHTFRRLDDRPGMLVVLSAIREIFHFVPPEALVLELLIGTTKLAWSTAAQRRELLAAKRAVDVELLTATGGDLSTLEGDRREEILHDYLTRRYRRELGPDEAGRSELVVAAAKEMGVYELQHQSQDRDAGKKGEEC